MDSMTISNNLFSNINFLVTARKGSKGVQNKCSMLFYGRPLYEYLIDQMCLIAPQKNLIVSTDIEGLIRYCRGNRLHVVLRDEKLASDEICIEAVIYNAIEKTGINKYTALVYGNIITRYAELFKDAHDFLENNPKYDAVISFQNVHKFNPAWMFPLNGEELPVKDNIPYRRQDLKQFMIHDGHTILFRTKGFIERFERKRDNKKMYGYFGDKIKPQINNFLIIDFDSERDMELIEFFISKKLRDLTSQEPLH